MHDLPAAARDANAPLGFLPVDEEIGIQHTNLLDRSSPDHDRAARNPLHPMRFVVLAAVQFVLCQMSTLPVPSQFSTGRLNHVRFIKMVHHGSNNSDFRIAL